VDLLAARGLVPLTPFIFLGGFVVFLLYRWMRYPPIFLCIFLALAGFLGVQQRLGDGVVPAEDVELVGIVQDIRLTRAGWQRLVVLTSEGQRILTYLSPEHRVVIGQRLRLFGDMHELDFARNPGGYNEFLVQRAQRINGKFFARDAELFDVYINLPRATYIIRNRIAQVYNTVLPYRKSNLIQSVVLGERPDMHDSVVVMYREAGIYHLLVVSGLHLSILMMAVNFILERFMNRRAAGLTSLALMIGYTLLTGASISTVRAVTMAGVAVFGRVLYRDRDALASVSFACIVLLLYEPLYLFSIGFQLSFATVFALILLTVPTERALALVGVPRYKKLRSFLAYNIVATVSTYPILAYHFSFVATYSIFVNLIIMPTATLLVIVGFTMGIVGLFSMTAAAFLAGVVYFLFTFYEAVIRFFLGLPGAVVLAGNWGIWVTLALLWAMLAFGFAFSGFGEAFRQRLRVLWLSLLVLVMLVAMETGERRRFRVTELDVGEGSSYVVTAGGHSFVIDGGGNNRLLGMNTGAMVVIPYLNHRGVARVCGAFVTDAARQRISGVIELVMADRVGALYVAEGVCLDSGLGLRLQTAARQGGVPLHVVVLGDAVRAGGIEITVVQGEPRLEFRVNYPAKNR